MSLQTIDTRRLVLRPPILADAEPIFQGYAQDPEVTRYLIWRPHRSIADTETFLRSCIAGWERGTQLQWVITRRSDGAVIGMLAANVEVHRVSVGYVLARPKWGKGYVPEALQAVVEAFWTRPEVYRIWAVCDVENSASARVLEKVGMQREGILKRYIRHPNVSNEPRDVYCYAITR